MDFRYSAPVHWSLCNTKHIAFCLLFFFNFQWVDMGQKLPENRSTSLPSFLQKVKGCWWQLYINCVSWRADRHYLIMKHCYGTSSALLWYSASSWVSGAVIIVCGTKLVTWALCYLTVFWAEFQTFLKDFCMLFGFEKYKFKTKPHKSLFNQIISLRTSTWMS